MKPVSASFFHRIITLVSMVLIVAIALSSPGTAVAHGLPSAAPDLADPFPARSVDSPTGSEFIQLTANMGWAERERAIMAEILSGNVPDQLRTPVPVQIRYREHRATVYVLPDYLAIGSNDDYVIIPMAPRTAMRIASALGFVLPTAKLVDDIYQNAAVQLSPEPMRPGPAMTSNAYYREHDCRIKTQLPIDHTDNELVAGHKKDVVLTPRLVQQPERVAIYGWHRPSGDPIQPLSLYHGVEYVDYSHGIRLVSRTAFIDGEEVDLARIFGDPELNPLVSDEGVVPVQSYL